MLGVVRCLIIDDNSSFLAAARSLLEQQRIVVVGAASNESEGLERARELKPDVILVDIDLGRDDGFSVARRLAAVGLPFSPVILISTHPPDDFAELVDESPAVGFIPKSELSARAIEELLNGRREPPSELGET